MCGSTGLRQRGSSSLSKVIRYGLLGLVASVVALFFIAQQVDLQTLGEEFGRARYGYGVASFALLWVGLLVRGQRWRILLSGGLPLIRAFNMNNVAYMINSFVPFRIGELARIYLATRADPPVPVLRSTSTIIVERLLDVLAVLIMLSIALTSGPIPDQLRATAPLVGLLALLGFLFLVFLSRRRAVAHALTAFFSRRVALLRRFDLTTLLDHFLDGLLPLAKISTLLLALLWTAISWGFSILGGYVLMYTFYDGADVSWTATMLYIVAASFAVAVPAVPGNIGTYEVSVLVALDALGYNAFGESRSASLALAFALTVHLINLAVYSFGGVVGLVMEGISLEQLSRGVRQVTTETNEAELA